MLLALLLVVFFAQAAPCNATLEAELETLLEEASLLLHNLSRQHLQWQCDATRAPMSAYRLASCQEAAYRGAETVALRLPTIESLAELLAQLAAPNDISNEVLSRL